MRTDVQYKKLGMDKNQYKYYNLEVRPIDSENILVYSYDGDNSKIFSPRDIELLFFCSDFNDILSHAENYLRASKRNQIYKSKGILKRLISYFLKATENEEIQIPISQKDIIFIGDKLKSFVSDGYLVSHSEILSTLKVQCIKGPDIQERASSAHSITTVGIPTCDRPQALNRILENFIINTNYNNSNLKFLVVDNSTTQSSVEKNISIINSIKNTHNLSISYTNRSLRAKYYRRFGEKSYIPAEILQFALLGDERCISSYGACRNALLLETQNELFLQVDDDILCDLISPPDVGSKLELSSEILPFQFWFHHDIDKLKPSINTEKFDIISLHESVLGKSVCEILENKRNKKGAIIIDNMNAKFQRDLTNKRVVMSFAGTFGDPGTYSNSYRFILNDLESFNRLLSSTEPQYRNNIQIRKMLRTTKNTVVSKTPFCMAINLGLDNRVTLPPFMPVQRGEDNIFGALINTCNLKYYSAFLPHSIIHDPIEKRPIYPNSPSEEIFELRFVELIIYIIKFQGDIYLNLNNKELISYMAESFIMVGKMNKYTFEAFIQKVSKDIILNEIMHAKKLLEERNNAALYWRKDINKFLRIAQNALTAKTSYLPADLNGDLSLFKELIHKFGKLLKYWNDIGYEYSILKDRGFSIFNQM